MTNKSYSEGSTLELIKVSLPVIISQSSQSLMMFTDRYFLSSLGKEYPSASMAGGFLSLMLSIFIIGLLSYITPLVAQFIGSRQNKNASKVLAQGLLISLSVYPFIYCIGKYYVRSFFEFFGVHENEILLAVKYFNVLNIFVLFTLLNTTFSCFFTGKKKTKIVMLVNLGAMLLNIPMTIFFIEKGFFGYCQGIEGAALATSFSNCFMFFAYLTYYFYKDQKKSDTRIKFLSFNKDILKKLIYFGCPTGVEFFLVFFAFNTFVVLFHSYGIDEAFAMTIVFNWDIIAFLPLWGLNIGIMSLVGQYLGANKVNLALRTTYSGLKIAAIIISCVSLCFWFFSENLAKIFITDENTQDYTQVLALASTMIKTASLYCIAEAINLVFSATLRASGDTRWCMWVSVIGHWSILLVTYFTIKVLHLKPEVTWMVFISNIFILSVAFSFRFFQGKWKDLKVV